MCKSLRTTVLNACILLAVPASLGQVSEYVVLSGDEATFSVIRGGVLLRQWSVANGTAEYQYPLAVQDTIRTMGADAGAIGAEYDLNGADLGARFTHPAGPSRAWDGTTDGDFNYTIDTSGRIYQLDLDWQNPVLLFDAGGLGSLTYDPGDQTLWVSQFSSTTIVHYGLNGTNLGSFSTGHSQNMALALDHADDTLWLHDRTTQGTFEQWTKAGQRLQRIAVPGMESQNALAGEFAFGDTQPCEPCDTNCDGSMNQFDIQPFVDALAPSPPAGCSPCAADMNGDGSLNQFDIQGFVECLGG